MMVPKDKIGNSFAKIRSDDLEDTLVFFAKFLEQFGEFMVRIGKLEGEHGAALKELGEIFTSREALEKVVAQANPTILGGLVKVLLEFNAISSKMNNMASLSPDEKVKLGLMLKDLSKDLQKLMKDAA